MVEEVKGVSAPAKGVITKVNKAPDGTVTTIKTTKTIKKAVPRTPPKTTSNPNRPRTYNKSKMTAKEREELLIENFVGLQKAMTHLSIKFEGLSENISRLLEVFELSAKTQLEKSPRKEEKDLLDKVENLIEQNKTIAKGLVLINEKLDEEPRVQHHEMHHSAPEHRPMPPRPPIGMPPRPRNKPLPRI